MSSSKPLAHRYHSRKIRPPYNSRPQTQHFYVGLLPSESRTTSDATVMSPHLPNTTLYIGERRRLSVSRKAGHNVRPGVSTRKPQKTATTFRPGAVQFEGGRMQAQATPSHSIKTTKAVQKQPTTFRPGAVRSLKPITPPSQPTPVPLTPAPKRTADPIPRRDSFEQHASRIPAPVFVEIPVRCPSTAVSATTSISRSAPAAPPLTLQDAITQSLTGNDSNPDSESPARAASPNTHHSPAVPYSQPADSPAHAPAPACKRTREGSYIFVSDTEPEPELASAPPRTCNTPQCRTVLPPLATYAFVLCVGCRARARAGYLRRKARKDAERGRARAKGADGDVESKGAQELQEQPRPARPAKIKEPVAPAGSDYWLDTDTLSWKPVTKRAPEPVPLREFQALPALCAALRSVLADHLELVPAVSDSGILRFADASVGERVVFRGTWAVVCNPALVVDDGYVGSVAEDVVRGCRAPVRRNSAKFDITGGVRAMRIRCACRAACGGFLTVGVAEEPRGPIRGLRMTVDMVH
ncbi:hypothetical protein B0H21DRAFT_386113 [Amylocystis lapponica]|nr:hypothetical protein B0H21DRAFT_386113 [Amylocystis lapponica]